MNEKMNEKVTGMVALLFKGVAPSEEVQALHDEVLNNCQDRFADLISSGLSEDECLAAVMESLKGMEEVLKDYPREEEKQEPVENPEPEEKQGPSLYRFEPEDIRALDAQLTDCDVEILSSEEGFSMEIQGDVRVNLEEDGTLRLWQDRTVENLMKGISWEKSLDSFEHFGDALNQLGQNLSRFLSRGIGLNRWDSGCRAVLRFPASVHPDSEIRTTSGDISWSGPVPGGRFVLRSTSGDMRVSVAPEFLLPDVRISTMSGDAEVALSAQEAEISTVSGDISWEGDAGRLTVSSTSGDAEVTGAFREIAMNTTSGDMELELTESQETDITVNAVSGDLELRLPRGVREIKASLKSVSGDVTLRGVETAENAAIRVQGNTVSGDLIIRG